MSDALADAPDVAVSEVMLAGAGPGDPDLLTVAVAREIARAKVIVHDALIGPGIRALFPAQAQVYDVGKRGGGAQTPQAEINALLAHLALNAGGAPVLRLKGGDPLVFGRGGEEAEYLTRRGIAVRVLPGLSSVNAATALGGIPLTHRGVAQSYTVLIGQRDRLSGIAWRDLVAQGGTWVFLMAKGALGEIARRLLAAGAEAQLGAALVENASLPTQQVSRFTLAQLAQGLNETPSAGLLIKAPGLLVVGPTVALTQQLFGEDKAHDTLIPHFHKAGEAGGVGGGWRAGGSREAGHA